jgi:hypothetical protein
VALVAAQQIIIQFYKSGVNAANNTAAANYRATANNEDTTIRAKIGRDTLSKGLATNNKA